jgi:predicted dehydrogenase
VKQIRIAVAGAGLIGRRHIEVIQQSTGAVLCGMVDPAPASAELAGRLDVPLFASLGELLDKAKPDAVIVATPNTMHVPNGLECIAHGVPALVEKPISDSVAEAERLVAASDSAKVPVLVGHHRRHSPLLARARDLVAEGTLGQLVAVVGTALFYKPDHYFDEGPWRREPGGGPILINLIHEIDDLRAVCGDIVAVQAFASNATRKFKVEDTVAINLRFASGALGTFMLSDTAASARSWEQTSGENKTYPHYDDEDCYLIVGTRGSLAVPTMRLKTYAGERSWWKPFETGVVDVARDDPLVRQLDHFCAVVRGEAAPRVSAREALETLRVTLGVDRAARTGLLVSTESTS